MSTNSTPQILSLSEEYILIILLILVNFLIIGLWSLSASCCIAKPKGWWFEVDLTRPSEADLTAIETAVFSNTKPLWYPSYFGL